MTFVSAAMLACSSMSRAAASDASGWSALQEGSVVLFRHANAPGIGDPPGFRLGSCSTQRNLDVEGKAQARRIGEAFRQRGIPVAKVWTSEWCRARETAQLAFPDQASAQPAFNSFFGDAERRRVQTAEALNLLGRWVGPGVLVVVTHQVNITALTGQGTMPGEGVIVKPSKDGLQLMGTIRP
jgi:phosphohistidine phosphatase SixA